MRKTRKTRREEAEEEPRDNDQEDRPKLLWLFCCLALIAWPCCC